MLNVDLGGRVALVTGGSRGVGRAVALMLADAGADVAITYRAQREAAEAVAGAVRERGVRSLALGGDLADPAVVERIFARFDEALGPLDLFVGNAGIWPPEEVPLERMSDEQWRRTMAVNLDAIFYTTRAAARRIRDGGRIVLVGSTAGQRGEAFHGDYAASKGAMISLVKGLCVELAPRDVTVNCVAPGWIDTDMAAGSYEGEGRGLIEETIPLGRVAAPEDVAGPIVFLCSDMARHITGEVLNVNGGAVLVG